MPIKAMNKVAFIIRHRSFFKNNCSRENAIALHEHDRRLMAQSCADFLKKGTPLWTTGHLPKSLHRRVAQVA